jgi:hypothetical protein
MDGVLRRLSSKLQSGWKRVVSAPELVLSNAAAGEARRSRDQIRLDLEQRGIEGEWLDGVVEGLYRNAARCDARDYEQLLAGIGLACRSLADSRREFSAHQRDLREMERLMGAFSGELGKLDEVLEVLAAYARRMRTTSKQTLPRVLH